MREKFYQKPIFLLFIGAVLTALTLIFPIIGFLQWFTMIPILIGVYRLFDREKTSLWKAYRYGFFTVYVYYVVIYHWFVRLYPLDFVGLDHASSVVVILAGCLGLPLLQAVLGGFIFVFYALIKRSGIFEKLPLIAPFAFASLWIVFEFSSTFGWTGVPWGRLALGQIEFLPMLQSASLFGSYFVSWLLVIVNGLLAYCVLYRRKTLICTVLAGSLLLSNLVFGLIRFSVPDEGDQSVKVAVIQGNINSHDKWGADSYQKTRDVYGELTRYAAEEGAELIVWPETAFPTVLTKNTTNGKFVCSLAKECDVTLIVGAMAKDGEGNEYNALFMIDPDGTMRQDFYAKRHLVPFGEYVPMKDVIMTLIPPLADLALGGDMTPGDGSALFETEWGKIGSLICFDSIYEELTLESVRDGASLMVLSSNDSWFYDSAAVYQHQAQAQLRAIESGRDFVRSANTGISSVISADGSVKAWIDPLEKGYAVQTVEIRQNSTLYTVIGNLFVYLCALFALALIFFKPLKKGINAINGRFMKRSESISKNES